MVEVASSTVIRSSAASWVEPAQSISEPNTRREWLNCDLDVAVKAVLRIDPMEARNNLRVVHVPPDSVDAPFAREPAGDLVIAVLVLVTVLELDGDPLTCR